MRTHLMLASTLLTVVLFVAGCDRDGAGEAVARDGNSQNEPVAAAPQEVVVRTRDYTFEAPDTIWSGPTTIRLVNEGPDFHHVWLVRLESGRTVGDLVSLLTSGEEAMPDWAVDFGGPNTPGAPGESTVATIDLKPGDYAMICVIPAPDGQLHVMKGMFRPLAVIPGDGPTAAMPAADLVMTLDDYSFETDRPITPGHHTLRVENVAAQAHEVVIVRLQPGRTAGDFLNWVMTRKGESPGKPVGGVTGLARGVSNVIEVDFEPGEYALLCFVPDAGDGQPHVAHGMVKQFRIG
ncbi:MAG: hypothetical protein PVI01_05395 [Gemmatimonadales bacterium]|jgi:hypothetical protein